MLHIIYIQKIDFFQVIFSGELFWEIHSLNIWRIFVLQCGVLVKITDNYFYFWANFMVSLGCVYRKLTQKSTISKSQELSTLSLVFIWHGCLQYSLFSQWFYNWNNLCYHMFTQKTSLFWSHHFFKNSQSFCSKITRFVLSRPM